MDPLLTPPAVGEYLHTPEATLAFWRHKRIGPEFINLGKRVVYRTSDVEACGAQQAGLEAGRNFEKRNKVPRFAGNLVIADSWVQVGV